MRNRYYQKMVDSKAVTIKIPTLRFEEKKFQEKFYKAKSISKKFHYKYAEGWDLVLLVCAISMSILAGMGWPILGIVYGSQTNTFMDAQMAYDAHQFFPSATGITPSSNGSFSNGSVPRSSPEIFMQGVIQSATRYSIVGMIVFVAGYIEITCWLVLCERQILKIRKDFFKSILHQDIAWFDAHQTGEMTAKFSDNLERMKEGMGDKLGLLVELCSSSIAGFIVAFVYSWKLTLILFGAALLVAFGCGLSMIFVTKATREESQRNSEAGTVAEEVLSCIRTVTAFNAQDQECQRYKRSLDLAKKAGLKKCLLVGIEVAWGWLIGFCMYALAFSYGAKMINSGDIDRGTVFIVLLSVFTGAFRLADAGPQLSVVASAKGAAASIFPIIEREPAIDSYSTDGKMLENTKGRLKFSDVEFRYPSRKNIQVLDGVSFTVEPGETVALVGSSGSGKSTVVNLLLRYYNPDCGKITIDGVPIDDLNINFLRNLIGVVSQEPVLFETTIEENIRFGKMDITRQDMVKAAKMANAHDFICTFPQGYSTIAGERGTQLSGGQKQRIAIARALVRDPKILLLDEATSALDAESESIVQEALDKASKGRTTIVVAHRLSTVRNADKILVMQHGRIVEVGRHADLMAKKDVYYQLVMAQLFEDSASGYISADESNGLINGFQLNCDPVYLRKTSLPSRQNSGVAASTASTESYISGSRKQMEHQKCKTKTLESEQKRLKTALEEEGIQPANFWQILKENFPEWPYLLLAFAGTLIKGGTKPVYSLVYGFLFRDFTLQGAALTTAANFWSVIFLLIGAVNAVGTCASVRPTVPVGVIGAHCSCYGMCTILIFQSYFFGLASEQLSNRLRMKVFRNVLRQHAGYFDDPKHSTGRITTRLATDAPNVKAVTLFILYMQIVLAMDFRLAQVISTFISMVGGIGLAMVLGWQLALLGVALLPFLALAIFTMEKLRSGTHQEDARMMEEAGKTSSEAIQNIRTVQALTRENEFFDIFCKQLILPYKHGIRKAHLQGITYGFSMSIFMFFYAASFRFGGFLVIHRYMEPITVYRVFTALLFAGFALGIVSSYFPEYVKAKFSAALIFKMINEEPKIDNLSPAGLKPVLTGSLAFQNVHFAYPMRPDAGVLAGMEFKVDVGQTMALVGASGCGKSTVVSLTERFYDPVLGQIMIDEFDLRTINIGFMRNHISLVSQEPILFDCSIEENIAYGLSVFTHEEVVDAAKLANIHNFISSLPQGYNTRVGEKGTQLSGGQKQRVAIARALVRSPRILLLDEATSALDAESEQVVQQALEKAREGRTCIISAHRLSTVQTADIIAVLQNGKIIEYGSHSELIALRGAYFHLTRKQASA